MGKSLKTIDWGGYSILALVAILFGWSFSLIPSGIFPHSLRGPVWCFAFGAAVGISELVSRYSDEPLRALGSPFGMLYVLANGMISVYSLFIILRYPEKFGFSSTEAVSAFLSAVIAGFGAMAVMRTRLMVLKGADNKDISIGPDVVIKTLLQMVDQYVDRDRAAKRLQIVTSNMVNLRTLAKELKKLPCGCRLFANLLARLSKPG